MTTIYEYRMWCKTELTYVYVYNTTLPTTCPHNTSDIIDPTTITIVGTYDAETTNIIQNIPGYYQMQTTLITVPSGATGGIYEQVLSFPMELQLWLMEFTSTIDMVGDVFDIIAAPETILGAITSPVNITDIVINVSSTIFTSGVMAKGLEVLLDNGATIQSLGLCSGIDQSNSQITVQNPPTIAYTAGSYVKINTYIVKNQIIGTANKDFIYGRKGITTKMIPANTQLKFIYTNNNGIAKNLYFNLEFNYY